jgi:hypothetical protein
MTKRNTTCYHCGTMEVGLGYTDYLSAVNCPKCAGTGWEPIPAGELIKCQDCADRGTLAPCMVCWSAGAISLLKEGR